ncbi:MAG: methyltransferase domain-containing protein [Planctomycetota bacterium]
MNERYPHKAEIFGAGGGPREHKTAPTSKARGGINGTILRWFSTQKRGKVLDAPAGHGHLAVHLKQMGYEVVCGEIEPEIFKASDIECLYIDLNKEIPAPDESFDYIICMDGLEHMTNPYAAAAEFARVLKPGGAGIFSVPNYSNMEERVRFLLRGYLTSPKTVEDYKQAGSNLFNFHNSPLTITLLDFLFGINGLTIEAILQDKGKWRQYTFYPFVIVLKLAALLTSRTPRDKYVSGLTLRKEVIFGGNTLIFITRKTAKA